MNYKLEDLKKDPTPLKRLFDPDDEFLCLIWSGEHMAWWGKKGCGYTTVDEEAGIYRFRDAWNISNHAGPEKQIEYHVLNQYSFGDEDDIQEIENIGTTNLGTAFKSRLLIGKCKTCGAIVAGSHSKDIFHHQELAKRWLENDIAVEWGGESCNVGGCKCLVKKRVLIEERLKELGLQSIGQQIIDFTKQMNSTEGYHSK